MCNNAQRGKKMNWDDLRFFLAVAREGSISGGAKRLGVQHSTLSRRLRSFEKRMGTRLVERKRSGYELTETGETLKQVALRMEAELLKVDGNIQGQEGLLSGTLRVTAFNSLASTVLMPMIARFSEKFPKIKLHLNVSNIPAKLSERDADVALRFTNEPTDTLIGKRLVTIASAVYGSKEYVDGMNRAQSEPRWLGAECCVFHQTWTQKQVEDKDCNFFSDDTLLTQAALRQHLGVAYLHCFMGDRDPLLQRLHPPNDDMNLGLWYLFHPDLKRNAKVLAFRDHLVTEIEQEKALFEGSGY